MYPDHSRMKTHWLDHFETMQTVDAEITMLWTVLEMGNRIVMGLDAAITMKKLLFQDQKIYWLSHFETMLTVDAEIIMLWSRQEIIPDYSRQETE